MLRSTILNIIVITVLISCGEKKSDLSLKEAESHDQDLIEISGEQFMNNGMALGSMEERSFPQTVNVSGVIDVPPENRATVSAIMGGFIKRTPLLEGDSIRKGQLLVVLENPEFVSLQQEYLEVKEQSSFLRSEYERQRILFEENVSSKKAYLKTESEFKAAEARYKGIRKQLEMLNISLANVEKGILTSSAVITAPISGSITKVLVAKGTYVSPATPILEIVNNEHIHLELSVFEQDIMKIKKGQQIDFRIPQASDKDYKAEVYLVGTSLDEKRSVKVHGHLKNEEGRVFITGMFVEALIHTGMITGMALPSEAVVAEDDHYFILKLLAEENGHYTLEKIKINPGLVYDEYTLISDLEGVSGEDRFLTRGAFELIGSSGGGHDH